MKKTLQLIAAALGLTSICMGSLAAHLVGGTHDELYHWTGMASQLFGPVVFDLLLFWVLMTALLLTAENTGRWRIAVWMGVLLLLLPRGVVSGFQRLSSADFASFPHQLQPSLVRAQASVARHLGPTYWTIQSAVALVAWIALVVLWRPSRVRRYERCIRVCAIVLAFIGLSGGLLFAELGWAWGHAAGLNDPRPLHQHVGAVDAAAGQHRVVFVVMDELSYDQVFGHRYAGLQLPVMEQLAKTSTLFTDVAPAGFYTGFVVPSLLTGESYDGLDGSVRGYPLLHISATGKWQRFDEWNTVFADAIRMGYKTAIVGWYNPYCRILPDVLDVCFWANQGGRDLSDGAVPEAGFWSNAVRVATPVIGVRIGDLLAKLVRDPLLAQDRNLDSQYTELHIQDYQDLKQQGDLALLDRSIGFLFLHLPVPHPGGIYDRKQHTFSKVGTTYIDNLALADLYLGHLREVLQDSGQWDSSDVVVMGDHSWRTPLWKGGGMWSPLEDKASGGGRFDTRPFYLVKLAGQTSGATVDTPYPAVRTRSLLDALLTGNVETPEQLGAWAAHAPEQRTKPKS